MDAPPPVFRAPMRSRLASVADDRAAVARALELGLVGVGGRLDPVPHDLAAAVAALAAPPAPDERAARRLARFAAAPLGSFVWTTDAAGALHLGRVTGPWRYDASAAAHAVDLVHVRDAEWLPQPVEDADAPAAVHETMSRGGRNWQSITRMAAGERTALLWEALSG